MCLHALMLLSLPLPFAGLYYPAGSLKARLCVEGRHALYTFCREHDVPHSRLGKLLVATSDAQVGGCSSRRAVGGHAMQAARLPLHQACRVPTPCSILLQLEALEALRRRAEANGVTDLQPLSSRQVAELEPAVRCAAALLSPSTGIVDSHRCAGVGREAAALHRCRDPPATSGRPPTLPSIDCCATRPCLQPDGRASRPV